MTLADELLFPPPQKLDKHQQCELINIFWPHLHLSVDDLVEEEYSTFLKFVLETLRSLRPQASAFAIQKFNGLFIMVRELRDHRAETRVSIKNRLRRLFLNMSDEAIFQSMELTLRLWVGLNVCSKDLAVGPRQPRDVRIHWKDHESLQVLVTTKFVRSSWKSTGAGNQLDGSFTAMKLRRIRQLEIRWTSNLLDHLKLEGRPGRRFLSIYQHKVCLINHQLGPQNGVIMADIIVDAVRTLDLLFPFGDDETTEFLKHEEVSWNPTSPSVQPNVNEPYDFGYWNQRISHLSSLFHGPPETILQTLLDRRHPSEWVTLWVSIVGLTLVTVIFGVLATVYAAKQYRLALASYDIAVKSFELSRALACRQDSASIPGFCD